MKLPVTIAVCLIAVGVVSRVLGEPGPVSGGGSGYNTQPVIASPTSPSTQPGTATSSSTQNDSDVDDSLYRVPTKDSPGNGVMLRDDGALREKPLGREKMVVVDSSKKLPSSGSDPKFQGSLLNAGLTSLDKPALKANETNNEGVKAKTTQPNPIIQARERDVTKKLEPLSASSKLDLSLLPAASATASPAAKSAPSPKQ